MRRRLALVEVPYHLGRAGVDVGAGPTRLVSALSGRFPDATLHPVRIQEPVQHDIQASFAVLRAAAREMSSLDDDQMPVVFAGNCITAVATCAALRHKRVGVVWFDAHGDFHTADTSPSGYLDGMALATLTGACWRTLAGTIDGFEPIAAENVVFVGGHDLDPGEGDLMRRAGISLNAFERGISTLARRVTGVYVHVDLDVLDTYELRANQWAKRGGISAEALERMVHAIADALPIAAVSFTAYDPGFDERGVGPAIVEGVVDVVTPALSRGSA
jgi:arginase